MSAKWLLSLSVSIFKSCKIKFKNRKIWKHLQLQKSYGDCTSFFNFQVMPKFYFHIKISHATLIQWTHCLSIKKNSLRPFYPDHTKRQTCKPAYDQIPSLIHFKSYPNHIQKQNKSSRRRHLASLARTLI